ncbi:MAG: hypothetical protein OXC94_03900 [Chloroflexi bacterium]|nr:hypothetical protein [Chloroflexota bacterium]
MRPSRSRSRSRGALALATLLLAAALVPAPSLHAQQQVPTTIWGPAESPSTEVVVFVDGGECKTASVGAHGADYVWTAQIDPGECGAATGSELRFTLDGLAAAEILTWQSGLATPIGLTVTEPAGAAPEPPATTAPAPPGEAEPGTITTTLHPGWNMVAWLGPEAPATELLNAVPALVRVGGWDAAEQRYRWRMPNVVPREGLRVLTTGMGLWLELGGDAPVEWTRPAREESVLLSLDAGRNLVGWAGRDGVAAAEALARFGNLLAGAWRWNVEQQAYERYRPGTASNVNTLDALDHGDALWVELTDAARWWQSGRSVPPVTFVGDVPGELQTRIRGWVHETRAVFAERWAVEAPFASYVGDIESITPTYIEIRGGPPEGLCANAGGGVIFSLLECTALGTYLHEYFHILQRDLSAHRSGAVPGWMIEGSASWTGDLFLGVTSGETTVADHLDRHVENDVARLARHHLPALEEVEEWSAFYTFGEIGYRLGFVAVDWLVDRSSEEAVIDFFRGLSEKPSWHEAFETAFGIASPDFYEAFAAYRADVAPALPHVVDDSADPVLVLVGEIAPGAADPVRARFARLKAFFGERFAAAGTLDLTLYVGERESLAEVHRRLFAEHVPEDFCTRKSGAVLVSTLPCYDSALLLLRQHLFHAVRDRLAPWDSLPEVPEGHDRRGPPWLLLALEGYLNRAYEIAAGAADAASARENDLWHVRRTTLTLPDLETPGDHHWRKASLSALAGEWLAGHAGEPALLDYYRRLPVSAGWREAFEAAFGLAVEDFYGAFAAHRTEVAPPYALHHVRGVVLDRDGHPAADTWIATSAYEARWEDITRTTADGAFDLEIRDGEYYLAVDLWISSCDASGSDRTHYHAGVVVDGSDVTGIEIRLPEGPSCAPT